MASHKMLTLQALSSSLNAGTAKRGIWVKERFLGDLRQSVPQNGRVHLLGVEKRTGREVRGNSGKSKDLHKLGGA